MAEPTSAARLPGVAAANIAVASTTSPNVNVPIPVLRKPCAIVTQREIWQGRSYSLSFDNRINGLEMAVLFWEDLSPDQKRQALACVHAGTMTALEAIPL